ncbi:MAG: hypothetical protein PHW54_03805 [Candidatus Omnitrophica bacterium]|jgi:hypothetical protein|nr:hypothetical protein [Candidatus Omnitrophota bacterium]
MTNTFFRQAIVISFLGHITLFGMFSFSFGPKPAELNTSGISFLGAILRSADFMNSRYSYLKNRMGAFNAKSGILALDKINRDSFLAQDNYSKPQFLVSSNQEKMIFPPAITAAPVITARARQPIMFYPNLPYHFALYFKDRQAVHIELDFQVALGEKRNSILVKRNISSGNLEADLLSMRYISRYIFIEQKGYAPNKWQTVKIDLSALKND